MSRVRILKILLIAGLACGWEMRIASGSSNLISIQQTPQTNLTPAPEWVPLDQPPEEALIAPPPAEDTTLEQAPTPTPEVVHPIGQPSQHQDRRPKARLARKRIHRPTQPKIRQDDLLYASRLAQLAASRGDDRTAEQSLARQLASSVERQRDTSAATQLGWVWQRAKAFEEARYWFT
ncbi:MAG: hypothetical protein WCP34_14790, partial [Pseudomonadota bacterium]